MPADRLNHTHFRSSQAYLLRERKMRPLTVRLHVAALLHVLSKGCVRIRYFGLLAPRCPTN